MKATSARNLPGFACAATILASSPGVHLVRRSLEGRRVGTSRVVVLKGR
jgi:hypothetical protein